MGYFVGMLGNLLPLPGGVGGVEGGMVGTFVAFGEPAGPALVAVLAYRLVADGVGAQMDGRSGLLGLDDRVAAMNGEFRVDSPPGGGTTVAAWIPVPGS